MPLWLEKREHYSRAEKISDGVIHVTGLIFALIAASVLVTLAAVWRNEPYLIIGIGIYCVTLVTMISASAAYHMTPWQEWKGVLQRLDHSAIYIKIAGTYTPFALITGNMGLFLAGIWGAALAGTSLRVFAPGRYYYSGLALYLGMGWAGVVLGGDLMNAVGPETLKLMIAGGIIYTLGVAVYLAERLHFHNTIWHAMVLLATGIFYAAILLEIAHTPVA